MIAGPQLIQSLLIYGITLPLAVIIGYMLGQPDFSTFMVIGLLMIILALPVLLNWHHPLLVLSWNATAVAFFLKGRPPFWMVFTALTLMVMFLRKSLDRNARFIRAPIIVWPLVFLAAVTLLTAQLTGGLGLMSFGSEVWGGRRYIYIWSAIAGFFALTSQRIPLKRARLYVALFILGGLTWAIASMVRFVGPSLYFLFWLFPVEVMPWQIAPSGELPRLSGICFAAIAALSFILARYGLRGTFFAGKPVRLAAFIALFVVSLIGGFRSWMIYVLALVGVQFFLEGLHRTRLLIVTLLVGLFATALLIPVLPRLPPPIQRSFAWLPLPVDPVVRQDVEGSTRWRVNMWKLAIEEVPRYFWLGKGYAIDPREAEITWTGWKRFGEEAQFASAYLAQDYHNGPLSVIIPLGVWGAIGFVWFLAVAFHVLYRNYKFGHPHLFTANALLFAMFVAYTIKFLFVAGGFHTEFPWFTGLLGFSLSLNGGICKPAQVLAAAPAPAKHLPFNLPRPRPALSR